MPPSSKRSQGSSSIRKPVVNCKQDNCFLDPMRSKLPCVIYAKASLFMVATKHKILNIVNCRLDARSSFFISLQDSFSSLALFCLLTHINLLFTDFCYNASSLFFECFHISGYNFLCLSAFRMALLLCSLSIEIRKLCP